MIFKIEWTDAECVFECEDPSICEGPIELGCDESGQLCIREAFCGSKRDLKHHQPGEWQKVIRCIGI